MPEPRLSPPSLPRTAAALLAWAVLVGCTPSDPMEQIRALQEAGRFEATIEPLRDVLDERPDDSEARYRYGLALSRTGQLSLADWSLSEAMQDPEWQLQAGQLLAFNMVGTGNYERAIEVANEVLEDHPDNFDVLLLRGIAYARSRSDPEAALADAERLLELEPGSIDAMEPKVLGLLELERFDEAGEAIEELGRLIEEGEAGEAVQAWHCATTATFADDDDQEELALERWNDSLERFPGYGNVVSGALRFFDGRSEFGRSIEILQAAYERNPESRDYRIRLTNRLRPLGRAEEAEALLRAATESEEPRVAALAWFDLAKHYQDAGDHAAASKAIETAVETSRTAGLIHPQLLFEYADTLILAERLDEALAVADETNVEAHAALIRARVAQLRGSHQEALEHYQTAFRLWPNNAFARYYAGAAAEQVGDFDAAVEAYRYSIRIAANATDARTRLARIHLAEGRPNEAIALLRHRVDDAPLDVEGEILSLRIWGLLGRTQALGEHLEKIRRAFPWLLGRAVASAADGLGERAGAPAAVTLIRSPAVDLTAPESAYALRSLVRWSQQAGEAEGAGAAVEAALAAHPEEAVFHEIYGRWLELEGRPAQARAAYEAALAIEPDQARALAGLGRLTEDPDRALELLVRAYAADSRDEGPAWSAIERLRTAGRPADAESQLEALLEQHPLDGKAAAALVELRLERGESPESSVSLARRAVRFGGGPEALDLLARVHRSRGEDDEAREAEERARSLREHETEQG